MTDSMELRKLIEDKGYKLKYVAKALKLTPYGLQLKIDNKNEFKTGEIEMLCQLLGITSLRQKESLFFARKDDLESSIA